MPSMADRALELQASRGFYVFPTDHPDQSRCIGLHNPVTSPCDGIRGKHPAVKWKTWAPIAKAKPELLEEAFRRRNNLANIGIACGPSKLVVLDEDQFNELKRWCTDMGITLPETYTVTTGRGKHLYFFWDHATNGPISNREQAFAGYKINVRGHGGLVIGEYSKHETGVVYTGNGMPIVPLPQEVADKLLHASGNSSSTPNAQTIWQHIPADPNVTMIADGDRHAALVAYAGRLRGKDLDYHEAKLVFRGRWLLCEQPDGQIPEGKFHTATCRYPVTWDEATAKLSSIYTTCPPGNNGSQPAPATKIDEAAFWNAYPELTKCRDYARAVRVGPWAMLGSALTVAAATIPPDVVLPAGIGDYASVNLFVNLVGESGAIKSQAINAARAWLHIVAPPDPVKPGSGQGIAKCYAYVKRTKAGPVQVGKRWAAVATIAEVDTLTAAGSMTGSSLWAELRGAWSDERVGHDYADVTKSVVLQPRRYRLCMVVGVQPLRAGPLFDDVDAGTPQRFVWFPTDDPGAPKQRLGEQPRLKLPAWESNWSNPIDTVIAFFADENRKLADLLDQPCDRDKLTVLKVPPEALDAVDGIALEKLHSSPGLDPLDGHQKLCQLKVAAALMRLCKRTEVTSKDWELAGVVMQVSDRTRKQTQDKLEADRNKRNLDTAKASGARKIYESRMAAKAEAEDIARIADVIVAALTKANGQTMTGSAIRRAAGRDRDRVLVPKALEYLEIDGRVKVEQVKQAGVKVTLLNTGQQTP